MTEKQKLIGESFGGYLDLIKKNFDSGILKKLELKEFKLEEKSHIDVFVFDILYCLDISYSLETSGMTFEEVDKFTGLFIDEIYKFSDFSKLFLPDRELYFSYNLIYNCK